MFYPYCTIGDNIEVAHTPLDETGHTLVHIEVPDAKYCFKTLDCLIPSYRVSNVVGMSDDEIAYFIDFCRRHVHLLLKYSAEGGIANALIIPHIWIRNILLVDENNEPIHVHVCKDNPTVNATKIWITQSDGIILCKNSSKIPKKDLAKIERFIANCIPQITEAWINIFGNVTYYC